MDDMWDAPETVTRGPRQYLKAALEIARFFNTQKRTQLNKDKNRARKGAVFIMP